MSNLYEEDENLWRDQMVQLLEENKLNEIDAINLKVMLIEMGKSEQRSVKSSLVELILHLLKATYQPQKSSRSWYVSINKQRKALRDAFEDSPSFINLAKNHFEKAYKEGRKFALDETGLDYKNIPEEPSFDFDYVMSNEYPKSMHKFIKE